MSSSTHPRLLEVEQVGGVTVVTLLWPEILSPAAAELIGRQLLAVAGDEPGQMLLSFRITIGFVGHECVPLPAAPIIEANRCRASTRSIWSGALCAASAQGKPRSNS